MVCLALKRKSDSELLGQSVAPDPALVKQVAGI